MLEPHCKNESENQKRNDATRLVKTELSLSKQTKMAEVQMLERLIWKIEKCDMKMAFKTCKYLHV